MNKNEQLVTQETWDSAFDAVRRDWQDEERLKQLRCELIEGCQAMADVYREIECAYHPLEEECALKAADWPAWPLTNSQ